MLQARRRGVGESEGRGLEDLEGPGQVSGALLNDTVEIENEDAEVVWELRLEQARYLFELAELILGFRPGCSST